ncbi:MAG TPA: GNAT family N-acetyltransferase [Anaerolineales bacterium]|nr:GNAT family N-acetyltransferase [Anaerolineales bacterium]
MIPLTHAQLTTLKPRFLPDRPGPLIGLHVIHTGHGHAWADCWPDDPRAILTETAGNYSLTGDPNALTSDSLRPHISGFVEAPETFLPLLWETFPDLVVWDRVIYQLDSEPRFAAPPGFVIRRLEADDVPHLARLSTESNWITKTWNGVENMAKSGYAWGAFAEGKLVSVANTFFVGEQYEDLGVVTEPESRGRGLNAACAGAMCTDIIGRGRIPSWSTSPDNLASMRVAEKLGFKLERRDVLYVAGIHVPKPPSS